MPTVCPELPYKVKMSLMNVIKQSRDCVRRWTKSRLNGQPGTNRINLTINVRSGCVVPIPWGCVWKPLADIIKKRKVEK